MILSIRGDKNSQDNSWVLAEGSAKINSIDRVRLARLNADDGC
jgi:hypothetical protein